MARKSRKIARHDRICQLIHQLAHLSRDGWHNASYDEYKPLERELYALQLEQIQERDRAAQLEAASKLWDEQAADVFFD